MTCNKCDGHKLVRAEKKATFLNWFFDSNEFILTHIIHCPTCSTGKNYFTIVLFLISVLMYIRIFRMHLILIGLLIGLCVILEVIG